MFLPAACAMLVLVFYLKACNRKFSMLPCCQDEALRKALVHFRVPADATALVCGSCSKLLLNNIKDRYTTRFSYLSGVQA